MKAVWYIPDKKGFIMKRIGIIGAMELEVAQLKEQMTIHRVVSKASMEFFAGTLNDVDVVIVRSGIGKVNAALCVQILADVFQVTHVINTGVAVISSSLEKR